MKHKNIFITITLFLFVVSFAVQAQTIRSAGIKGNWSSAATWVGGVVPGANNDVVIVNGDSVFYDLNAGEVKNVTIGENATTNTGLFFKNDGDYQLTAYGSIVLSGDSTKFYAQANSTTVRNYVLNLHGDLLSDGTLDFKTGSSPNNAFLKVNFIGTTDSRVKCNPFVITPSTVNEWGSITINKTGGARVTLLSDIGTSNISAVVFTLVSGKVFTGENTLGIYATGSGSISGGSQDSYVVGKLGRGWASSGSVNNKIFPIGDSVTYRPVWISNTNSSYHLAVVQVVDGNANTGTSSLLGGIDKISSIRYYKVTAGLIPRSGTIPSPFVLTKMAVGYYEDDGVAAGNTNLRLALATTNRDTWANMGPTSHTTVVGATPTQFISDSSRTTIQLDSVFYFALARVTGTTENSLGTATAIHDSYVPSAFDLKQNFPNPFNPNTTIAFSIPSRDFISLKVYNVQGELVASLLENVVEAGTYSVDFDAAGLNSGVYFYQLQSSSVTKTAKMILLK